MPITRWDRFGLFDKDSIFYLFTQNLLPKYLLTYFQHPRFYENGTNEPITMSFDRVNSENMIFFSSLDIITCKIQLKNIK